MIGTGESRKEDCRATSTNSQRLRSMSSRNLMECRIGNSGGSHRRRSVQDSLQRFHYLGITTAAVGLGIRLRFPEAVTNRFRKIRRDTSNHIKKTLLLAQHRNYFLLNQAGKFRGGLRFESNDYMTRKHTFAPLVF